MLAISVYPKTTSKSGSVHDQIPLSVWRQIPLQIPAVLRIAPYSTGYQPISFAGKVLQGAIIGADEALESIIKVKLARGHFVSFVESFEHFCVIGDGIVRQVQQVMFTDPIGKQLRIGQALYTIIGVAKPWQENGFFNEDINQSVIIPIAGMALVSKNNRINNAVLRLKPDSPIDKIIAQVKQIISSQAPELNLLPRSAKQVIASMESQGHIFTLLLAVIGGIALLVGGIGVMNVMLVSVSERKKEIGVRKAVGAKNREIQALFLTESIMLAFLGGVLGVLLGLMFTRAVAYFTDWPFTVYFMPPLAGFAVSVATGIFFGFYPARRAAKLPPMVSLRNE